MTDEEFGDKLLYNIFYTGASWGEGRQLDSHGATHKEFPAFKTTKTSKWRSWSDGGDDRMYRGSNQVFHRQRNLSNDCFEMGLTWAKVEYYEFLYSLTMFLFVSLWTLVYSSL